MQTTEKHNKMACTEFLLEVVDNKIYGRNYYISVAFIVCIQDIINKLFNTHMN